MNARHRCMQGLCGLLFTVFGSAQSVLLDTNTDQIQRSSHPIRLGSVGNQVYFSADDTVQGRELWTTDGTRSGTRLLADVNPGEEDGLDDRLNDAFTFGNRILFNGITPGAGGELWVSDGTTVGTQQVIDLLPGPEGSEPQGFTAFAGRVYFTARDSVRTYAWWVTDGTATGTTQLAGVPSSSFRPRPASAFGNHLYFSAETPAAGLELWRTDGTFAGTGLFYDINPGTGWSIPSSLTVLNGALYFIAGTASHGRELWCSDGTVAGTTRLTDVRPGSLDGVRSLYGLVNGHLLFEGQSPRNDSLWSTDGTPAGTRYLGLLGTPGVELNGRFYFVAQDAINGSEIWSTDGTVAGTRLFANLAPGAADSWPHGLARYGNEIFFATRDNATTTTVSLWLTDGTLGNTRSFDTIEAASVFSAYAYGEAVAGSNLLFSCESRDHGFEWFATDGSPTSTNLLLDIAPPRGADGEPSIPVAFTEGPLAGVVLYRSTSATDGAELYLTDATSAGTRQLLDLNPGPDSGVLSNVVTSAHLAYFIGNDGNQQGLFASDGTVGGTRMLLPINGNISFVEPMRVFAKLGRTDILQFNHPQFGTELWRTDGSASGTQLVADIAPGRFSSRASDPLPFGGGVLFAAEDRVHGKELWWTDGSGANTRMVLDIAPGSTNSDPKAFTLFDGRAFFIANPTTTFGARELWTTYGTTAGTRPFFVPTRPRNSFRSGQLHLFGGYLYFACADSQAGGELWRSDGTVTGTVRFFDIEPGSGHSDPGEFISTGDKMFFMARTSLEGR